MEGEGAAQKRRWCKKGGMTMAISINRPEQNELRVWKGRDGLDPKIEGERALCFHTS
jgi:hypothetical protein